MRLRDRIAKRLSARELRRVRQVRRAVDRVQEGAAADAAGPIAAVGLRADRDGRAHPRASAAVVGRKF
jgi:hypothetical protein